MSDLRELKRECMRRLRKVRRAFGLCVTCAQPSAVYRCGGCSRDEGSRWQKTRAARRAAGCCYLCGELVTGEHKACAECRYITRLKRTAYFKAYRAGRKCEGVSCSS